jgi:hypothetical protein
MEAGVLAGRQPGASKEAEEAMSVESKPASRVSGSAGVGNVPPAVCDLSMFTRPDYIDFFTVAAPGAAGRSPEDWARAILEPAALSPRKARLLWRLMGLRLGPPHSAGHVQGWEIAGRGDTWLRAETASWYLTGRVVFLVEEERVSVSLSLRYDSPVARWVWALVSRYHQRAVPVMLHRAAAGMAR